MLKKILPVLLLGIAAGAVFQLKNHKQTAGSADPATENPALPKLLDLGAGKCVPCKAMAPILDEMKLTFAGRLQVEFIDIWENKDAGERYAVRMIPTQIFYDADGNELFRHEGFFSRDEMLNQWEQLGYTFAEAE